MTYGEFVNGITAAYEHRGGIKTLALGKLDPSWFAQIQRESASIIKGAASSDVTDVKHVTNWTRPSGVVRQFSLFNSTGNSDEYTGDYGYLSDMGKKRLVFPEMKSITRFAELFQGSLRSLRLNGMGQSSKLSAHEENSIAATKWGPQHIVRFHLPIFTNPNAWIYLDDERFRYAEGVLYFFHHGCVHAASNDGAEPRYHFVLDCFLNRNLYDQIINPSTTSIHAGYNKLRSFDRKLEGEPFHFTQFVREGGKVVHGEINYGRKAPGPLAYWKKNYPSVFGAPRP